MDTDLPNSLGAFIRDLESETKTKHDTAKWLDEQMQPRKRARTEKPTATPALESVPLPTTQAISIPPAEPNVKQSDPKPIETKPTETKPETKPTETKPESKPKPKPKPETKPDAKPTEAPKTENKTEA